MRLRSVIFLLPLFMFLIPHHVNAAEYVQLAGLLDTRTTFSDGKLDPESLARLAKEKGFDILFINDHDRLVMEYGLPPLKNVLRKREELNSINKEGAERFLDAIRDVQKKYPDMIIIPGSESAPFYYWTGSYLKGNLTAHKDEQRILTVGLERPGDYEELPILHNGISLRYFRSFLPVMFLLLVSFILGVFMSLRWRGFYRISGLVISGLSVLFMLNTNAFRNSPFDQYHGDQGIAPYQLLIDYVKSRGGMTFWNYPETKSGVRKMGPISVNTPPYPEVLEMARGYTGFSALYGDNITVIEPGHEWDRVLMEYCKDERDRPVWGISTADFHEEGRDGGSLGDYPTVFLVREKTKEGVVSAMREGKMYAYRGKYPQRIVLDEFCVCSSECRPRAISGDHIILQENPRIHISLSSKMPAERPVTVRLIRSGEFIRAFEGKLPLKIDYEDRYYKPGQKIYYRIDVRGCGDLVSNPIFVVFG